MSELLPTNRVFLIRLSGSAEPDAGIHRGRIEHIRSGRTAPFSSFENVEQFISEVLSGEKEPESTGGIPDQSTGKIDTDSH